jgi:hypothetical protein
MNLSVDGSGLAARKMPHTGQYDSIIFGQLASLNKYDMQPTIRGMVVNLE